MNDRRGGVGGYSDRLDAVPRGPDVPHVLLQGAEDRGRVPKDVDALGGGDIQKSWDRGGEANEVPLMRW
jgi:hypothetical protein